MALVGSVRKDQLANYIYASQMLLLRISIIFSVFIVLFTMSQSSYDFSTSEYEFPTPKTPRRNCTRDERLKVQTLYLHAGCTIDARLLLMQREDIQNTKKMQRK